jgi:hypothetical protein
MFKNNSIHLFVCIISALAAMSPMRADSLQDKDTQLRYDNLTENQIIDFAKQLLSFLELENTIIGIYSTPPFAEKHIPEFGEWLVSDRNIKNQKRYNEKIFGPNMICEKAISSSAPKFMTVSEVRLTGMESKRYLIVAQRILDYPDADCYAIPRIGGMSALSAVYGVERTEQQKKIFKHVKLQYEFPEVIFNRIVDVVTALYNDKINKTTSQIDVNPAESVKNHDRSIN